ncbi:MAG: MBG domain-containing protein, partial [Negativicutes bacterium]
AGVYAGGLTGALAGLKSANYVLTAITGDLTLNKAPLTITANAAAKTYGDAYTFGTTAFTTTALKNNETVGNVTLASAGAVTDANVIVDGGYAITPSSATGGTFNANNYTIIYSTLGTLTVNPAAFTVTANSDTKTYGDAYVFGTTAFTTTALKLGQTVGSVTLTSNGAATGANVTAGGYAITPSNATGTFNANNYTITYSTLGTLTVNKAAFTVTANSDTKTYGDAYVFATTAFTTTALKNNETVGNVTLASAGAVTDANVIAGGGYAITPSSATGGTFNANNYTITYSTLGTLTVNRAPVTITASDATKIYGDFYTLGTTAFAASGLKNSETVGNVTLTSAGAATDANVIVGGGYAITPTNASGGTFNANNYTITYSTLGTLTVNPAALTDVKATDFSRVYGDANPVLTGTASGWKLSDTDSLLTGFTTNANSASDVVVGGYLITATNVSAGANYSIDPAQTTNGALMITQAPLIVTADSLSRIYGIANPTLTGTITGFKNGQDSTVLTTQPLYATTATPATPAGIVPITASGAAAQNYSFSYIDGTLTITYVGPTPEERAAEQARQAAINAANNANNNANNTTNQKQIANERTAPVGNSGNTGTANAAGVTGTGGNQLAGGLVTTTTAPYGANGSYTGTDTSTGAGTGTSTETGTGSVSESANTNAANGITMLDIAPTSNGVRVLAIAEVNTVVTLPEPVNSVDYFVRGNALANNGNNAAAVADYSKALEETPEFAQAYFNRGLAKENLNQRSEALADFRKAISIEPGLIEKLPANIRAQL